MSEKYFFAAFSILYDGTREKLSIHKKEDLYRHIFTDIYNFSDMGLYDDDPIRKITSGNAAIHARVMKKLHTYEGFEIFRKSIEQGLLPYMADLTEIFMKLKEVFQTIDIIPNEIIRQINNCIVEDNSYQQSKAIAAILVCMNYADYMYKKNIAEFIDISFMRLSADKPIPHYPKYITDAPNAAVDLLIGRETDLNTLNDEIIIKQEKILLSAVGGLGKTELVKCFLNNILHTDTAECGVEVIAWIPYDNQDIRLSFKQSLRLHCDLEDVWSEVQELVADYGNRLLVVIDNIESANNDEYLKKLSSMQCRMIVTSRQRKLYGFNNILDLEPLELEACRELFYKHYEFEERDNEIVNDIIELTAKLTIMIVFIAKAAYLEGMSLYNLYNQLVDKGFKLSEEDVSCEHEKMQNDETIIRQMCILFSLVNYSEEDKIILTYISVIPNLQFDLKKAKQWFKIKKNSSLMKLYNMGMLEHIIRERSHIYWMHSVIAAAVREQQKEILYDTTSPFIHELSEEMEFGDVWGKGYTKLDLIPFSWSIADVFENHWGNEDDSTFLLRLYYICFEASSYSKCMELIEKVIEIDKTLDSIEMLIRDYKNYSELLSRIDRIPEAIDALDTAHEYMKQIDPEHKLGREWAYLWHQYGNIYYHNGVAKEALDYYTMALEIDLKIKDLPPRELATDYSSIAMVYQMYGDLFGAYEMLEKAIGIEPKDDEDSESIMHYYYKATICTDLVSNGYDEYCDEAREAHKKVVEFREKYSVKNSNDLADAYLEYANFLYQIEDNENALIYCDKAANIYFSLYGSDSYHMLQCMSTKALIAAEIDGLDAALNIYGDVIERSKHIKNIPLSDMCSDYQNYADLLEHADRYEESIIYYDKCINMIIDGFSSDSPLLAQPYIGRANCCIGLKNYEEAIEYLSKLKNFAKEDALLLRLMKHKTGTCYAYMEEYKTAVAYFKDALDVCDKNEPEAPGYIYTDLSITYNNMGKHDKALYYGKLARDFAEEMNDDALTEYVHTLDIFLP